MEEKRRRCGNNNERVYTVSDRLMDVVRPLLDRVRARFAGQPSSTQFLVFLYTLAYITDHQLIPAFHLPPQKKTKIYIHTEPSSL